MMNAAPAIASQPFAVAPVAERLRTAVPALRQVGTAADFAAMTKLTDFAVPSAYVMLAREKAETAKTGTSFPDTQSAIAQRLDVTFGVVLAVRNYRQQAGAQLADALDTLLGSVRAALLGWTPAGAARACTLVQGDLTQYDRATAIWTDVWRTSHAIRSAS